MPAAAVKAEYSGLVAPNSKGRKTSAFALYGWPREIGLHIWSNSDDQSSPEVRRPSRPLHRGSAGEARSNVQWSRRAARQAISSDRQVIVLFGTALDHKFSAVDGAAAMSRSACGAGFAFHDRIACIRRCWLPMSRVADPG